jgi:signal transduction histidine kinase
MNLLGKTTCVPESHELRVLSAIGQQIGVAIENARLYSQVQSIAAIEERERLGRELHDGLAQVLGYLYIKSYNANTFLKSGDITAAQAEVSEMQQVAGETQRDVREAILGLRTTITPGTGVVTTLAEFTRRFSQQSGIHTRLVSSDETRLEFEPSVEIQLLRIVQEALTNTRKHSMANQAFVRINTIDNYAVITIEDNGIGFDPDGNSEIGHYGIHTMIERAQSVGGETRIIAKPGQGTKIIIRLPLKQGRII